MQMLCNVHDIRNHCARRWKLPCAAAVEHSVPEHVSMEVPGIDGETGFVTEVLTEDQFEQRAAKLEVIQRIRVV